MRLFLFRFWPVFLPLLIYWVWFSIVAKKARREGRVVPRFRDGPIYWLVLGSLLVAVACFVFWSAASDNSKGAYVPPHMENGVLIPGHVVAQ